MMFVGTSLFLSAVDAQSNLAGGIETLQGLDG